MKIIISIILLISPIMSLASIETSPIEPSYNDDSLRIDRVFYKSWINGYSDCDFGTAKKLFRTS